jgi:predicted transcriptional regulator
MDISLIKQTQARPILNNIKIEADVKMTDIMKSLITGSGNKQASSAIIEYMNSGGLLNVLKTKEDKPVHYMSQICAANNIPCVIIHDIKDNSFLFITRKNDTEALRRIAYQLYCKYGQSESNPCTKMVPCIYEQNK